MRLISVFAYPVGSIESRAMLFSDQKGDITRLVFAEHPEGNGGLINNIETVLTIAFDSLPQLRDLQEDKIEIFTTLRLMPSDSKTMKRISRVMFPDGMKRKAKGLTLAREWFFHNPTWARGDEDLGEAFDLAVWNAGYVVQTYDARTGWGIPAKVRAEYENRYRDHHNDNYDE